MIKKIIFLAASLLIIAIATAALAQDATDTAATVDETAITAQDLGVDDPSLLPDSKFYFLKSWGQKLRIAFAFNPVKKAELNLKYASEKLLEAQKLAEKTDRPQLLEKATELYNKKLEQVQQNIAKFKDTATTSERVSKFLDKFVQQQALQEKILDKLSTRVSTATLKKITQNRERYLEQFGQVMQKLENKEQIQARIQKNLEKVNAVREKVQNRIQQRLENVVGGDRDEHGCIGSAGYSWCEAKQKCLRVWEEECEPAVQ